MFKNLLSQRGLSLDRLHTFLMVAKAGGISRAAAGNPVQQSLFSRQIRELEEFFGVELTRRLGKSIVLTPTGEELARLIQQQLLGLSDFQLSCKQSPISLTIGAGDSFLHWLILPKLGRIQAKFPNVKLAVKNLRNRDIIQGIQNLNLDFGVVRSSAVIKPLSHQSLGSHGIALFVPTRLWTDSSKKNVPEQISQLPFAVQGDKDDSSQQTLKRIADKMGIEFKVKLECESFPEASAALLSGEYATILPDFAQAVIDCKEVKQVPIPEIKGDRRHISLTWNPRTLSIRPVAQEVLALLIKELKLKHD